MATFTGNRIPSLPVGMLSTMARVSQSMHEVFDVLGLPSTGELAFCEAHFLFCIQDLRRIVNLGIFFLSRSIF